MMEHIGLCTRKFNYSSHEFEKSLVQRIRCHLILLFKAVFLFKIFLSNFFGRNELIQLWMGKSFFKVNLFKFHKKQATLILKNSR